MTQLATEKQIAFINTLIQKEIARWDPENLREATNEVEREALSKLATYRANLMRLTLPADMTVLEAGELIDALKSGDFSSQFETLHTGIFERLHKSLAATEEITEISQADETGLVMIASYMNSKRDIEQPYLRRIDSRLVADYPSYHRENGCYVYTNRVIGDTESLSELLKGYGYTRSEWGWEKEFSDPSQRVNTFWQDDIWAMMIANTEERPIFYERLLSETLAIADTESRRAALKAMAHTSISTSEDE